jgi:hypothetical protein
MRWVGRALNLWNIRSSDEAGSHFESPVRDV